uniref:GTP-binding protein alpha subunit gna n=1 Tax=Rhizophora mucronata TaxID=61149 RepID=A0A2P2IHG8_RHIMU
MIQTNLCRYIGILLEVREQFEEETLIGRRKCSINQCGTSDTVDQINDENIYSIAPRLKSFSDWLVNVMVSGNLESMFPDFACDYGPFVEDLWKDAAIQATYDRRNELGLLPRFASYFLEQAVEIARTDYEPSELDILYAQGITSSKGLSSMEFSYPTSDQDSIAYEDDPSLRYQLIRVHPNVLGGNCKWVERFEDVDVVLFCVSLTDYDEVFEDKNGVLTNKIMASKQLFESIATHRTFEDKKFLLILNKFDLLEEKIGESPLSQCEWFHDFNPLITQNPSCSNSSNTNPSLAHRAFHYIAVKFKRLFNSLTDKKLYVSLVTGLEPDNVEEALKYAKEILRWDEEELWHNNELSSTSIEASSSP